MKWKGRKQRKKVCVREVEIDIWSIWQSEVGRDGRMNNWFPWIHITTGELQKVLYIKCWKPGCYLWVYTFVCTNEVYFGWWILHSSGVNDGRMSEKQRFITRTTSSLCTLSLMLCLTCNYFRKLNTYTFRRFLLSTPVKFLFNTTVIPPPFVRKGLLSHCTNQILCMECDSLHSPLISHHPSPNRVLKVPCLGRLGKSVSWTCFILRRP